MLLTKPLLALHFIHGSESDYGNRGFNPIELAPKVNNAVYCNSETKQEV